MNCFVISKLRDANLSVKCDFLTRTHSKKVPQPERCGCGTEKEM